MINWILVNCKLLEGKQLRKNEVVKETVYDQLIKKAKAQTSHPRNLVRKADYNIKIAEI